MLSQTNSKKGISIMIGYLLLVSFAITMGAILYTNLKTYVPAELIECPEGASIFLKNYTCEASGRGGVTLTLNLKNNGRFNLAGYFISAATSPEQEIATTSLSPYFEGSARDKGVIIKDAIIFEMDNNNTMKIGDERNSEFNIPGDLPIYLIEIIPVRFQERNNKIVFASCGNIKVSEQISCPNCSCSLETCLGETCTGPDGTCYGSLTESVCENPATVACGSEVPRIIDCGTSCGTGTLCPPGEKCINGICGGGIY